MKLATAREQDPLLQRLRHALRAGRHPRTLPPLSRHAAAVALVPDPHGRLPHLPGEDRPRHRQEGVRRPQRCGLQDRTHRQLQQVELLRAVPRDRLQLRQPSDGAGGHLLLLHPRRRPPHHGAGRFGERALALSRLRAGALLRARQVEAARNRTTSANGISRARFSPARTRSTTTTSSGRASDC